MVQNNENRALIYVIRFGDFALNREEHGAMVRAWRSADIAACRAVSNIAWCRIFREISCFSPHNLGTLCPWARHFTLKCFETGSQMLHLTQEKMRTW